MRETVDVKPMKNSIFLKKGKTVILIYYICMCLCVLVCVNFGDEILLRGEECKTREKFNFFEKG